MVHIPKSIKGVLGSLGFGVEGLALEVEETRDSDNSSNDNLWMEVMLARF